MPSLLLSPGPAKIALLLGDEGVEGERCPDDNAWAFLSGGPKREGGREVGVTSGAGGW